MRTPCPRTINKKICYQVVASCWIFYFCMHFVTRKILRPKKEFKNLKEILENREEKGILFNTNKIIITITSSQLI
jgi:p-aminobenzoyl-glutamate transporter AbgT